MKFYVILTANFNDGTADKKAIYEFDSSDAAIANFHSYMGQYMNKPNTKEVLCLAINSDGGIYKNENWKAPVAEIPEATVEEAELIEEVIE